MVALAMNSQQKPVTHSATVVKNVKLGIVVAIVWAALTCVPIKNLLMERAVKATALAVLLVETQAISVRQQVVHVTVHVQLS